MWDRVDTTRSREGAEAVAFLARSRSRASILEFVSRRDGVTEREIRERVDCSRTTVRRNIESLLERDWIEERGREYSASASGGIIADRFSEMVDTVETTARLQPFLRWMPADEFGLDVRALRDAAVVAGDAGDPLAAVNRIVRRLEETDRWRAVSPFVALHPFEVLHERTVQGDLSAELVVASPVAETLRSNAAYSGLTREMLDSGALDVYVCDREVPYYLGLLERRVQIGAENEGRPRALIEDASEPVRSWATDAYEDFRDAARPLSGSAVSVTNRS
ncbi:MAG: helix-turn-helix transcriptional regulator [Haloarculaceae archaeon]